MIRISFEPCRLPFIEALAQRSLWVLFLKFFFKVGTALLFCSQMAFAGDYVITVMEAVSSKNIVKALWTALSCREASKSDGAPPGEVDSYSSVRVHRTLSFSETSGVRDNSRRGQQLHEVSISSMEDLSQLVFYRILNDWRHSAAFSEDEMTNLFDFHRQLSTRRLKFLTIEDWGPLGPIFDILPGRKTPVVRRSPGPLEKFASLRIYDSSPVPKSYGRSYRLPGNNPKDTMDLAEKNFPEFSLTQALGDLGLPRASHTWSVGMLDLSGEYRQGAFSMLMSQVADLLDLHYNQRDYLTFESLDFIRADDVDIVFYGEVSLKKYYLKKLSVEPLKSPEGAPLRYKKNQKEYFIYHIKGSDFIKNYLDFRFHESVYGDGAARRNERAIWRNWLKHTKQSVASLNAEDYSVDNFSEFLVKLRPISKDLFSYLSRPGIQSVENFRFILGRFLLLRRDLPHDFFDDSHEAIVSEFFAEIARDLGEGKGEVEQASVERLLKGAAVELLMRDPMSFLINWMPLMGED